MGVGGADAVGGIEADPAEIGHVSLRPGMAGLLMHRLVRTQKVPGDEARRNAAGAGAGDEDVRVVLADPALERERLRRGRATVGGVLVERHVIGNLRHQRVQEAQRVALGLAAQLARNRRHRRIDGGEIGGAQEHAGRETLIRAAQHAAGVVGLDQPFGDDLDVADRPAGQHVGDVAERVLMHVQLGIGGDVDLPFRDVLPVMAARRHAQDLDHAGGRRLVAIGRGVLDSQAHGGLLFLRRHSGAMRQHRTRNLEIPGLVLRTIPE